MSASEGESSFGSSARPSLDPIDRRAVLRRIGEGSLLTAAVAVGGTRITRAAEEDQDSATSPSETDAGEAPATAEELVVPPGTLTELPDSGISTAGRIKHLIDYDRSVWLDTGDGWVSLGGHVFDVRAFGAKGDGEADDWSAFQAAIEAMTSPLLDESTTPAGRTLLVPPGRYRIAQTLVLNRTVRLCGVGSGLFGDSILAPDPGIVGIIVEASDPVTGGANGRRAEGAIIEYLQIEPGESEAAAEAAAKGPQTRVPGVWLRARATLRRCVISGFGGNGIHIISESEENQRPGPSIMDGWAVDDCRVEECGGHGLYARGGSFGVCTLLDAANNGGWGVSDESVSGNTYVQCRTDGNRQGPFRSVGDGNRSLFLGCYSANDQAPSEFADRTIVVGGNHAAVYEGGNAWTVDGSRMHLLAQNPDAVEDGIETAPTLAIQGAQAQRQPHLLVTDAGNGHQAQIDATGRCFIGPMAPGTPVGGSAVASQMILQLSGGPLGSAGVRWVVLDRDFRGWAAQARAFYDAVGPDAPFSVTGFGGLRLTFQTPTADGQELDTLTLRSGSVGVGTIAPAAALEVASTTQGFLPPRMTTEQRDGIAAPPEGSLIYNLSTHRLNVHDGDQWREVDFAASE